MRRRGDPRDRLHRGPQSHGVRLQRHDRREPGRPRATGAPRYRPLSGRDRHQRPAHARRTARRARPPRRCRRQPLRPRRPRGDPGRTRHARRAGLDPAHPGAAHRTHDGRAQGGGRRHSVLWRPGAARPRGDGRDGRRHDRRPDPRAARRRHGGHRARRPHRRGAGDPHRARGRRLPVAGRDDLERRGDAEPGAGQARPWDAVHPADRLHPARDLRHRAARRRDPRSCLLRLRTQGRDRAEPHGEARRHRGTARPAARRHARRDDAADVRAPTSRTRPREQAAHRPARGRRRPHPPRRRPSAAT